MTYRAVRTLQEVDVVAAEDTRHTGVLLQHFNIAKPMISYHEHNKAEKRVDLIQRLLDGQSIGLVSDAGMPAISDPGEDFGERGYRCGDTHCSFTRCECRFNGAYRIRAKHKGISLHRFFAETKAKCKRGVITD